MASWAVVFDMDGLMLDTEPLYKAAWQQSSRELGYLLPDTVYATLVGRPTPDCEGVLRREFGQDFPLDRFRVRWPTLWRTLAIDAGISVKPGLHDLLAFLSERRVPVAVATSSEAEFTEFSLRQAGLTGRFGVVVTGDEVERGKPAPDIYLTAAARLGVSPERCMALEDSEAGIVAASRAGMLALMVPDWLPASDIARHAAFDVFPSLVEAHECIARVLAGDPGQPGAAT